MSSLYYLDPLNLVHLMMMMIDFTLPQCAASASVLGVGAHLLYFMHGEHHRHTFQILAIAVTWPVLSFVALIYYADFPVLKAALFAVVAFWSSVGSLWTSMLIYRAFFHRLHKFPGPFGAKLTKLWHSKVASNYKWYKDLDQLHTQYGEYVRTGPTEISIADPAAIELIYGARTSCTKSPWYDLQWPSTSLQLNRDKAMHDKRRRVAWERAFSTKALRGYDSTVIHHADELMEQIQGFKGKPVNVSKWYNYYTADMMSALGFGKPFNMLKTAEDHWTIKVLAEGSMYLATLGPLPWMCVLLSWFPFLVKENLRALDWTIEQINERRGRKVEEHADIMHWLLNPLEPMSTDPKQEAMWIHADARLLIVAGTDTTTAALAYISYHLAKDSKVVEGIRKELVDNGIDREFSCLSLQSCEYLQAVIDEGMRLHPPVPDGVYRLTPPEGLQIGETFIPGNVTVIQPIYTMQRSPKCFVEPNSFIPERWTTRPELVINKKAFMPFSIGPYSCVGRQLALNEIRTVISKLVLGFDIGFAHGEDGTRLLEDTLDNFVLGLAELNLTFTPRKA